MLCQGTQTAQFLRFMGVARIDSPTHNPHMQRRIVLADYAR